MTDLSPAEIQAQAAELLKTLDTSYRPELDVESRYNRFHRAAAVLISFDPLTLQPAPGPGPAEATERRSLVQDSTRMKPAAKSQTDDDGAANETRYVLKPEIRRAVLEEMATRGVMIAALEANPQRETSPAQIMLDAYIRGDAPPPGEQNVTQLTGAFQATQWLGGILPDIPAREAVQRRWDYLDLVRPFDYLAGGKFRGREQELNALQDYVLGMPLAGALQPPLVIYGPGGVGKSALSAKFVQDNAIKPEDDRFPWAYLDFDRTILDPEEPLTLVIEAVRQLAVQYPERAEYIRQFQDYLRSVLERSARRAQEMNRPATKQAFVGKALEVESWNRYLPDFASLLYSLAGDRPFMLALDTFEEVQYRSSRVVRRLFDFLRALQEKAPQTRPVLAGRNPVHIEGYEVTNLELKDFAPDAARALLEAEGVPAEVAAEIVAQTGGSPLSLMLALELWRRAADDVTNAVPLEFRLQEGLVQGQLFTRILGHIHDEDVRALAYPGLVLRRVTPDLIRNVLARYCDVKVRDDAEARRLFDLLAREEALVTVEGDVLRHRSDVRRIMLNLLRHQSEEQAARVRRIEKAAVRYYSKRESAEERAEEIYHRLSLGQSASTISKRWTDGVQRGWTDQMRRYLFSAREELGPGQRAWLAAQLGFELTPEEALLADQASWEQDIERKARGYLEYKKPAQALEIMLARPRWLQGSPLYLLAAQAWLAQERWDEAAKAARRGFDSAADKRDRPMAMQLGLLGAAAEMRLGHEAAANAWLDEVAALADELDDIRLLEVDLYRRAVGLATGNVAAVAAAEAALQARFDAMPEDPPPRDPAVLAWLAGVLGPTRSATLAKALRMIGFELTDDAALHRIVISLAEWDVAVSKQAGEPPGQLLRRIGVQPDPSNTPSQMWRAYLYGGKPDGLGRDLAALLANQPDAPASVSSALADGLLLRAGERVLSPRLASAKGSAPPSPVPEVLSDAVPPGKVALRLSGPQVKNLSDALQGAFVLPEFDEMLKSRLDRNLVVLANVGDSFPDIVRQTISSAEREGWTLELVQAAREARPGNAALAGVASELGIGAQPSDMNALEVLISQNKMIDPIEWPRRLGRLEGQICRVEINGRAAGTGFLVGPEAVLTAVDVIAPVLSGQASPDDVALRFDYKATTDGRVLNEGRVFRLADAWLLDSSAPAEFGYALLLVADRPGYTPIGSGRAESYAELREWIRVTEPAPPLAPGATLSLLFYPFDAPLKISFQTVIEPEGSYGRLTYRSSVGPGAAGAPGFDTDLEPALLHLDCDADGCGGVSLARVVEQLRINGQGRWLGEQAAAL